MAIQSLSRLVYKTTIPTTTGEVIPCIAIRFGAQHSQNLALPEW